MPDASSPARRKPAAARAALAAPLAIAALLAFAGCASAAPGVTSLQGSDASEGGTTNTPAPGTIDGDPEGLFDCMAEQGAPIEMPTRKGNSFTYTYPESVSTAEADIAFSECAEFLPGGGEPADSDPETLAHLVELAECMREHGVADYPDPDPDGVIAIDPDSGIDPTSPEFVAAQRACVKGDE